MDAPPLPPIEQLTAKQGKLLQKWLGALRDEPYDREDMWQFIGFVLARLKRSKAQLFQDLWALWVNDQKRGGYFVEAGAADGVHLSNTYLLETEMGWRGVLAEPNPRFAKSLATHRRARIFSKCLYATSGETLQFMDAPIGEFSRLADINPEDAHEARRANGQQLTVESISLNDLLTAAEAPARIDFLSLDTEGSEFNILSALDFSRWSFNAIAVEHNGTALREDLHALLSRHGYRRVWPELSRWDDWYVPA